MAMEKKTIVLSEPVVSGNKRYESLTLVKFELIALRHINNNELLQAIENFDDLTFSEKVPVIEALIPLIAEIAQVPEKVIQKIILEDMKAIVTFLQNYLTTLF